MPGRWISSKIKNHYPRLRVADLDSSLQSGPLKTAWQRKVTSETALKPFSLRAPTTTMARTTTPLHPLLHPVRVPKEISKRSPTPRFLGKAVIAMGKWPHNNLDSCHLIGSNSHGPPGLLGWLSGQTLLHAHILLPLRH